MRDSFPTYVKKSVDNLFQAVINIVLFLPYFFSVKELLQTLFSPWKQIETKSTKKGFNLHEFGNRIMDNFVSRAMGAMVRSSVLWTYLIIQLLFVLLLPFVLILYCVLLPLLYILLPTDQAKDEKNKREKDAFVGKHMLVAANRPAVEAWFSKRADHYDQLPWWSKKKLFSTPPIGRGWTSGYTPTLDQFAVELTSPQQHHAHLVGRNNEITHIEEALCKSMAANVLLIGEEGVGKRILLDSLAKRIYEGKANPLLSYKRIMWIDIEKIISKTTEFVQREETLSAIFKEAAEAKNIIIAIHMIDKYLSSEKDHSNFSSVIAEYAKGDTLQFIASTTPQAYQKYLYQNTLITPLFESVEIKEVTVAETIEILLTIALTYEVRYALTIPYETIVESASLTDRYIANQPLPEKAIMTLDEACVFTKAHSKEPIVLPQTISELIEQQTHIPTHIDDKTKLILTRLVTLLANSILFQAEPLQQIASTLRKSFVLSDKRTKPFASMLLLGPTGVGKTETAKAITRAFFNNPAALIRFDMSAYQSKLDIPKLIGSPDSGEPGLLTATIRQNGYGVLLLDEIEKADSGLLNIFLTILDEGYFTDGYGRRVDCKSLIIIATSNAGADFIYSMLNTTQTLTNQQMVSTLTTHLIEQHIFSPEFLNRFDSVIAYNPLTKTAAAEIAARYLETIKVDSLAKHGITITISPGFISRLIEEGYDPKFGARNLKRVIREKVEDRIAQVVLTNNPNKTLIF